MTTKHTFPRKKSELRWLRELSTTWRLDTWEQRQTWQHGLERWTKKSIRLAHVQFPNVKVAQSDNRASDSRGPWRLPALGQEVHYKHHQVHTGPSLTVLGRERQFASQPSEMSQNLKSWNGTLFCSLFNNLLLHWTPLLTCHTHWMWIFHFVFGYCKVKGPTVLPTYWVCCYN